jgi:hypothetical protein
MTHEPARLSLPRSLRIFMAQRHHRHSLVADKTILHFVLKRHKKPPNFFRRLTNAKICHTIRSFALRYSRYFCQVRFLWRFAFKRFLRLCLFI